MADFVVDIVRAADDPVASSPPARWAVERLRDAIRSRRGEVRVGEQGGAGAVPTVVVGGPSSSGPLASAAGVEPPNGPETLALLPGSRGPVAVGGDARGLSYAVLELADRVAYGENPVAALRLEAAVVERPSTPVRSVARLFCSEVEDKGWFHDERFWERYLSMLAVNRFNRFSLTLGLGYNYHRDVTDAYLYFAYPFLVRVPGYDVHVPQLPDEERERNLAMLRFLSERAVERGLDVQLGLWTHAYEWIDSPGAHHTIEGLTPETHATYCREAITVLLESCPAIGGVTLRVHGESGVPEGSRELWRAVFDGIAACSRPVGIDLHAKGLDEVTLGDALRTGLPVTVSPKFWAEHMGLPYHQAAIRENERVPRDDPSAISDWHRYMKVSEGSRPFTRYGYADFLQEDRPYDIVFRLWAGTQRVLLWGDPAFAAAYGRTATERGARGLEWCEPLTFKGREGSGVPGSRTGYAHPSLIPTDDWEKFAHGYRLLGRLTYDPDASPEAWRRPLRATFGEQAGDAEAALAAASRILPLVTVAHHPSASNNYYWPEVYTDMPIVWSEDGTRPHPYIDTPEPRRFGTVSPLDPEVFQSVEAFVTEQIRNEPSGRLSPIDVAAELERLSGDAGRHLVAISTPANAPNEIERRRWSIDIAILEAVGRFFAGKLRAAVGYERFRATGDRDALAGAVAAYRDALAAWRAAAARANGVYAPDLTYGPQARIRGHWLDRTPAIEADVREMEAALRENASEATNATASSAPVGSFHGRIDHSPPSGFRPGEDLVLRVAIDHVVNGVTLRYRPMDQALAVSSTEMRRDGGDFVGVVPASKLGGQYALAYAFVLRERDGTAHRHPGLGQDLCGRPYFVTPPERAGATGAAVFTGET